MRASGDILKLVIRYGDLEAEMEGTYDEVWKFMNDFLKQVKASLVSDSRSAAITTEGKSVSKILIELRNNGFFNEPKNSKQCFNKLKDLGKTDITPNAVSMALKSLVMRGELKRISQGKGFVYVAPYIGFEGD